MVLTIIVTTLAVCGFLLIVLTLFDALLLPQAEGAFYVVFLQGDAAKVEQTVRAALRLRHRQGLRAWLIFVDDGIDTEAQIAVELLLRRQNNALLCAQSQLAEIIRTENERIGTRAD